eukprot:19811-Lingulodinium_polyedra.AAC.1
MGRVPGLRCAPWGPRPARHGRREVMSAPSPVQWASVARRRRYPPPLDEEGGLPVLVASATG